MKQNTSESNIMLRNIIIAFFTLFIFLWVFQWCNIQGNINKMEEQNGEYIEKMLAKKDRGPFLLEYKRLNRRQVVISPKEIEKINNHIKYLSDQVYDESNRAQEFIDKDIDRLNLYMAVGIGFMTLIGVFVPLLINILSYQDFKDKLKEHKDKLKEHDEKIDKIDQTKIDKAIKDSDTAIKNVEKALEKSKEVNALSESVDQISKTIPKISALSLQYAIVRYFNLAPYLLSNLIREEDKNSFINLLESIRSGFEECENNDEHSILNDKSLQSTIKDFIVFIREPRSHSLYLNKKICNKFFELCDILDHFLEVKDKIEEKEHYKKIDDKILEIIELNNNYNAKTEPAT